MNLVCLVLTIALQKSNFFKYYTEQNVRQFGPDQQSAFNLKDLAMFKEIMRDSFLYQIIMLLNFLTTLAIFPAVTVLIEPSEPTGKVRILLLYPTPYFTHHIYLQRAIGQPFISYL